LKRTNAGFNFIRVIQPTDHKRDESIDPIPEYGWSTIEDDKQFQKAEEVLEEISKEHQELRSSDHAGKEFQHSNMSSNLQNEKGYAVGSD
jgi:hypothetical protein